MVPYFWDQELMWQMGIKLLEQIIHFQLKKLEDIQEGYGLVNLLKHIHTKKLLLMKLQLKLENMDLGFLT